MGRQILFQPAAIEGRGIFNIDLNEFASGTYIMRISNARTIRTERFFVGR
jgi:hypothetical protein